MYTYVSTVQPAVTSLSPTNGNIAGGTLVTITGTGFTGATAVKFGGTAATGFTVRQRHHHHRDEPGPCRGRAQRLRHHPGRHVGDQRRRPVHLYRHPDRDEHQPDGRIHGGRPHRDDHRHRLDRSISGQLRRYGGHGVHCRQRHHVTATSPAHGAGAVDITVTTLGGTSATGAGDMYTYVSAAQPTVTSISPTTGSAAGGTTVTITGTGLTGASAVSFGGTPATGVTVVSPTSVTAVSPSHTAGTADVAVTTPGGMSATVAGDVYTYVAVAGGGGGGPTPTVPATPVRLSGSDRFGTAIAASAVEFPSAGTAGAVVLARADDYPDALVGAALASAKNAPLLFANGGLLTPATQAEIQRVLPAGGTVYLLGGTAAIPATVATSLTSLGFVPVRYSGSDRFGTALAVADALNDPSTVLLATGVNFPDALAAGPAAAHVHGVVLLTNGSSLTPAVTAYLAAHPGTVYAIGGPAVAADPSAIRLSGADRYATAAAVASTLFTAPANVGVASGTAFPDALSGGAFQAHFGGPIVLTDPGALPASTSTYLTGAKTTVVTTNIFGGTTALSVAVQTAIGTALGL